MLILTRNLNQTVVIADHIFVTVRQITEDWVRLGVTTIGSSETETATWALPAIQGEKQIILTMNQTVSIREDLFIQLVANHLGRVRLGIRVPREVPVHRQEVYEALKRTQTS